MSCEQDVEEITRLRVRVAELEARRAMAGSADRGGTEEALRVVAAATSAAVGQDFFRSLVRQLAALLRVRIAFISQLHETVPGRVRLLALWEGSDFADNFEYDVKGKPCEQVFAQGLTFFPENVSELFPQDAWLRENKIESYLAIPLLDSAANPVGHLGVVHTNSMCDDLPRESMLRIFAARAGVEIERKQVQAALAESEKRSRSELAELQHIYDAAPIGLCLMDTDLRYLRINQWLADINGISVQDHIGRTLRDIVPEIAESMEPVYREVVETGEPALDVLASGATPADPQDVRHFMASYYPLKSSDGVVWGLSSIVRDVTEQKRAEDELRRSEERYRQLVANIHDALIVDDKHGRLTYANERFFELFGFAADDLPAIKLEDYVAPAYHEKQRDFHDRRMRGEEVPRQFEYEGRRKDGSSLWLEACVTPVTKDGVVIGTQSLIRDATARKRAEEQLRQRETELAHATRLSVAGQLATGIAHELNQPLATIVNYAESARLRLDQDPGGGSEETSVRLEKIAAQATRAGEIIHRMRRLLRTKEPQWSSVDLNECASFVTALIKSEARLKGVSLGMRLAADIPAVSGDAIQIQQVLLNLVRNGMDAIAERLADGHTLLITTELVDNRLVRCSVCDSGVGLPDDTFDSLFKPLYTTKRDGLGLGLSVSRWIIEAHGGQISAARGTGGGAVFSFVLPIVRGDDHGGR